MKHTYKERLEAGMAALGWTQQPSKSSKYTTWKSNKTGKLYFVGNCGALRTGECSSKSYGIDHTNFVYTGILAKGDAALAAQSGVKEYV